MRQNFRIASRALLLLACASAVLSEEKAEVSKRDTKDLNSTNGTEVRYHKRPPLLEYDIAEEDFFNFHKYKEPFYATLLGVYVVLFLVSFVGNLAVFIVIVFNNQMRNATNYFLLNLAIADMLVTVICVPPTAGELIYKPWVLGKFMCGFTHYIQGVVIAESVITIVLVSVERFLIIKHPFESRKYLTKSTVIGLIIATWLMCFFLLVPLPLHQVYNQMDVPRTVTVNNATIIIHNRTDLPHFCLEEWKPLWKKHVFDIFLFCLIYVVPAFVIVGLYTTSGCSLLKGTLKGFHQSSEASMSNSARVIADRRKIAILLLVVAILFALSWLPYQISQFFHNFYETGSMLDVELVIKLKYLALVIGHSNCAQNPILYFLLNTRFRRAIQAMCGRHTPSTETTLAHNEQVTQMQSLRTTGRSSRFQKSTNKPAANTMQFAENPEPDTSSGQRSARLFLEPQQQANELLVLSPGSKDLTPTESENPADHLL